MLRQRLPGRAHAPAEVPGGAVDRASRRGQQRPRESEGVGGEPGTVEVYHVPTAEHVDAVDVGKEAGRVAFWKMEE